MKKVCLMVAGLCAVWVFPQEEEPAETGARPTATVTEQVKVTATRGAMPEKEAPRAITVLSLSDRGLPAVSMAEILGTIPGVFVDNRHHFSLGDRLTIRGMGARAQFGVRGLKLILDGIPLTFADGQAQLNNLDLASVGRVEILRGPSSSLYGNASGGVIDLRTVEVENTSPRLESRLLRGGDDHWQGRLRWHARMGSFSHVVAATHVQSEGYRAHADGEFTRLNWVARGRLGDWSLTTVVNLYEAPYLLNPGSLSKQEARTDPTLSRSFIRRQGSGKAVSQGQAGITVKTNLGRAGSLESTVFAIFRGLENPIPNAIIDLNREAGGWRNVFHGTSTGSMTYLLGFDLELQRDERREYVNGGLPPDRFDEIPPARIWDHLTFGPLRIDQRERVFSGGAFADIRWSPHARWLVNLGARYDRYAFRVRDRLLANGRDDSGSRNMDALSPMLGASFRASPAAWVYLHAGAGFQTPTTTELGNRPDGGAGISPDLEPERSLGFEVGWKLRHDSRGLTANLAIYVATIEDLLTPFQLDAEGEDFFRNAGEARGRGLEWDLAWKPSPRLSTHFAYTLTDFQFQRFQTPTENGPQDLAGKRIPGVAPHSLHIAVSGHTSRGFWAGFQGRWNDRYWANDHNGPPNGSGDRSAFFNDAYTVCDLNFGLKRGGERRIWRLTAGVDNLFDRRYHGSIVPNAFGNRFFEPAADRTWRLTLGVDFLP